LKRLPIPIVLLLASTVAVAAQQPSAPDLSSVETVIRSEVERQKIPGTAVAIVKDGKVLLAKGYGQANVEHQVPVTPDTIFQSGSVGKQFTAAAVMLMVEQGKLTLDDALTRFFPDAPAHWSGTKVRTCSRTPRGSPTIPAAASTIARTTRRRTCSGWPMR
jgi:CubicO group peptidase (beta-lactamase class C family)